MEPRIGEPLPRADAAYIDPRKLVAYALDRSSQKGRHKAVVFERALGIEKRHWRYLRDEILHSLPHFPVSGVRLATTPENVTTWEVLIPVLGTNGRTLRVLTGWRLDTGRPELATARVLPKHRQPPELRSTL